MGLSVEFNIQNLITILEALLVKVRKIELWSTIIYHTSYEKGIIILTNK
jgi:hypothetical protein